MPRSVVGLLTAIGTVMSVAASLAHGSLFLAAIVPAALATGFVTYLALPPPLKKKT
jgi:hypothetical protein